MLVQLNYAVHILLLFYFFFFIAGSIFPFSFGLMGGPDNTNVDSDCLNDNDTCLPFALAATR